MNSQTQRLGMIKKLFLLLYILLNFISCQNNKADKIEILETGSVKPMPDEWIDKDTGHKEKTEVSIFIIIRLFLHMESTMRK